MLHYLKLMLQLLMAPTRGWEDVAEGADSPRRTLRVGLLPLAALAGLTALFGAVYEINPSWVKLASEVVVEFVAYSVAYFAAVWLLAMALPRFTVDGLIDRERIELFCAYCIGMMALIGILENLMPAQLTLLQFLPIYVMVVVCMARRFLNVDEANRFRFTAVGSLSVIAPVYLIIWLLGGAAS